MKFIRTLIFRILFAPLLTALLLAACGSRSEPPGEAVSSVFGVMVPQGSYQVAEEDLVGNEGAPYSARYLVTPKSIEELDFSFSQAAERSEAAQHRHHFEGGVVVTITPIDQIPRTHLPPVHPVLAEAPSSMESWIILSRQGQPDPCPPCPEGFTGTTVPGCTCD